MKKKWLFFKVYSSFFNFIIFLTIHLIPLSAQSFLNALEHNLNFTFFVFPSAHYFFIIHLSQLLRRTQSEEEEIHKVAPKQGQSVATFDDLEHFTFWQLSKVAIKPTMCLNSNDICLGQTSITIFLQTKNFCGQTFCNLSFLLLLLLLAKSLYNFVNYVLH